MIVPTTESSCSVNTTVVAATRDAGGTTVTGAGSAGGTTTGVLKPGTDANTSANGGAAGGPAGTTGGTTVAVWVAVGTTTGAGVAGCGGTSGNAVLRPGAADANTGADGVQVVLVVLQGLLVVLLLLYG